MCRQHQNFDNAPHTVSLCSQDYRQKKKSLSPFLSSSLSVLHNQLTSRFLISSKRVLIKNTAKI